MVVALNPAFAGVASMDFARYMPVTTTAAPEIANHVRFRFIAIPLCMAFSRPADTIGRPGGRVKRHCAGLRTFTALPSNTAPCRFSFMDVRIQAFPNPFRRFGRGQWANLDPRP